jgi:hypothetical protein
MPKQAKTAPVASPTPAPAPAQANTPDAVAEVAPPAKGKGTPPSKPSGDADPDSDFDKAVAIMKGEAVPDDEAPAAPPPPKSKDDEPDDADAETAASGEDKDDEKGEKGETPAPPETSKKDPDKPADTNPVVDKTTSEKPPETLIEKNWAKLAEADRQLREEKAKIKSEREQFQKDRERLAELDKAIKTDPFAVLKAAGIKEDDMLEIVAQRTLSGGKPGTHEAATKAKSETEELRGEIAKLRQDIDARDQQQKVDAYVGSINQTLSDERFDLLRAYPNAVNEVLKYAAGHYDQHGELLRPDVAAATIQEALIEQLRAASKTKTWQATFAPADSEEEPAVAPKPKNSQQPSAGKTLTNKHGQRTPPREDDDDLDVEERIDAAARLVKFGPG